MSVTNKHPGLCGPCGNVSCVQGGCVRMRQQQNYTRQPSVAEQMGVDPISKLADAINNLADALRTRDASES